MIFPIVLYMDNAFPNGFFRKIFVKIIVVCKGLYTLKPLRIGLFSFCVFLVFTDSHVMLVQRMIGSKLGTGGSSGYQYLRSTVRLVWVGSTTQP